MDKFSLEIRIGLIFVVFAMFAIVGVLTRATTIADDKIEEEVASVSSLLNSMFSMSELGSESPFNQDAEPAFLSELVSLENIRHIDIRISSDNADYPQVNLPVRESINAPDWFIALVYPDNEVEIMTFTQSNGDEISIYADPGDEIEEVWNDAFSRILGTLTFLSILFAILYFLVRRWMSELDTIHEVLDNVEHGDFSRRIPSFSLPEFVRIGDRINHLASSLGASKSENERLTRKTLTVQEDERRFLAQELHDSMGQSVSAIKAIAVSITERSKQSDPVSAESAKNIQDIADSTYGSVRDMMTSLRPSILDELGLNEALKQMVDDWNVHHEDTFCRLLIEGDYSNLQEDQGINLYRIVQEALTNISKYANAENVSITLSGSEIISLLIMDDGIGFAMKDMTQNMGLTGIHDRVTLLGGELQIDSKPGHGVSIQIEFPRINSYRRRLGDR